MATKQERQRRRRNLLTNAFAISRQMSDNAYHVYYMAPIFNSFDGVAHWVGHYRETILTEGFAAIRLEMLAADDYEAWYKVYQNGKEVHPERPSVRRTREEALAARRREAELGLIPF